jgi:hypothetical protein
VWVGWLGTGRVEEEEGLRTYAGATLVVEVGQAGEALLAAGAGHKVALAALREHALADDARADGLVAAVAPAGREQQGQSRA